MIVNSAIAAELMPFPNIVLAPVVFQRLVDFDRLTWRQQKLKLSSEGINKVIRSLPDSRALRATVENYFEVRCWRHRDVTERFSDSIPIRVACGSPPMEEWEFIKISESMLSAFPMLWYGDIIITGEIMSYTDSTAPSG